MKKATYRRNGQEIRRQRTKSQSSQRESKVTSWGILRDICNQPDGVQRPEVVILHGSPESLGRDGLAIVHVTLGGVVAEHAVDHDGGLAVGEPPIGTEPFLGLHG